MKDKPSQCTEWTQDQTGGGEEEEPTPEQGDRGDQKISFTFHFANREIGEIKKFFHTCPRKAARLS
jgi:hypothetical protein